MGDVAALLGGLDHLADGGVRKVEQRQRRVGRVRERPSPALASSFFSLSAAFALLAMVILQRGRALALIARVVRHPDI